MHDGGVTAAPGLYLMGLPFLRRRKSTLIDGAAADARELAEHLVTPPGHARPSAGELRGIVHGDTIPSPPPIAADRRPAATRSGCRRR